MRLYKEMHETPQKLSRVERIGWILRGSAVPKLLYPWTMDLHGPWNNALQKGPPEGRKGAMFASGGPGGAFFLLGLLFVLPLYLCTVH